MQAKAGLAFRLRLMKIFLKVARNPDSEVQRMWYLFPLVSTASLVLFQDAPIRAETPPTIPVLLDTDIGTALDDAFALALVLASPELDLKGVTTVHGDAHTRALVVCRMLESVGRGEIPVASGCPPRDQADTRDQLAYGLKGSFRKRPLRQTAVDFLYGELKARPGELTLLALGPLTNIARLLRSHPECKPWINRIVLMGGALRVGYNGKPPPEAEWNIHSDIPAAQTVFASGVRLVVAPLDATTDLRLEKPLRDLLFSADAPLPRELRILYELGDGSTATLFDTLAVALCFDERFCTIEDLSLEVDNRGITRGTRDKPNARVATAIRHIDFLKWYLNRLGAHSN
jgi:inosine-uridine nucleoside N-ribohydrolase